MFSLPYDVNFEILSYLTPHEIVKIESINKSMSNLCQDEIFWEQYVKNKYDPNYYINMHDGSFDSDTFKTPWDNLLERSNIVIRPNEKELWKILAIWIDKAKPIRSLFLDVEKLISNNHSLISQYDRIRIFANIATYIYGDDISVIHKKGNYIIKAINDNFKSEVFPKITANTIIKDINIRGRNLIDYITTKITFN